MRRFFICLAAIAALAACSKPAAPPAAAGGAAQPAPPTAPAGPAAGGGGAAPTAPAAASVSGTFTVDGKPATLSFAGAYKDEPFGGQPVTALVFTQNDQKGDAQPADDALFRKLGDAIVAKVQPDGTLIEFDLVHAALKEPSSVSLSGPVTLKDFKLDASVLSGHLTTSGPTDVFGQSVVIDLTFRAPAP